MVNYREPLWVNDGELWQWQSESIGRETIIALIIIPQNRYCFAYFKRQWLVCVLSIQRRWKAYTHAVALIILNLFYGKEGNYIVFIVISMRIRWGLNAKVNWKITKRDNAKKMNVSWKLHVSLGVDWIIFSIIWIILRNRFIYWFRFCCYDAYW